MTTTTIVKKPRTAPKGKQQGHRRRPPAKHQAACSVCGTATLVPFKPAPGRAVYCPTHLKQTREQAGLPTESQTSKTRQPADRRERRRRNRQLVASEREAPRAERAEDNSHPEVFAGLDVRARTRSSLSGMGITEPTPIQEQAIPALQQGRDVVAQARTGSGKTLAFGIPLIESCSRSFDGVQGLVLVPTRELAIQVASVLDEVADHRVSVTLLYGGRSVGGEKRALQKKVQIVVGTPGRTLDHLRQGNLSLDSLRTLVLDEADEMLDRGFARDVEAIIAATPESRQTALFSATLPQWVATTSKKHLRNPETIKLVTAGEDALKIEHVIYKIDKAAKYNALTSMLDERGEGPVIVFGKTKHGVKKLAAKLEEGGYPAVALQGNLAQNAREKAMQRFRSGDAPVLVATNVAARGLDVEDVARVINYDLPDSSELFTHRVGRTGRMGKSGEAITFVTPDEEKKWREIERTFGARPTILRWGKEKRTR